MQIVLDTMFQWPNQSSFDASDARKTGEIVSFPHPAMLNSPPPKADHGEQSLDYWLSEPNLTIHIHPATPNSPGEKSNYFADGLGSIKNSNEPITPPSTPGAGPNAPVLLGSVNVEFEDDDSTLRGSYRGKQDGRNYWLHHTYPTQVYDLTRPPLPVPLPQQLPFIPPRSPHLALTTTTTPLFIDPDITALVILDTTNGNLVSPRAPAHQNTVFREHQETAMHVLKSTAIPAARAAGIQIIWLSLGIAETEIQKVAPMTRMSMEAAVGAGAERIKVGDEIGKLEVPCVDGQGRETGEREQIDGGHNGVIGSWNTELAPTLQRCLQEGQLPTVRAKDRQFYRSTLGGINDSLEAFLHERGIKTLLMAGLYTETSVLGTMHTAGEMGFDTILLRDACAARFGNSGQDACEMICSGTVGLASSSDWLEKGVAEMVGWSRE